MGWTLSGRRNAHCRVCLYLSTQLIRVSIQVRQDELRFPGAMRHEVLLRRTGIVRNTELCTAPALQRTAPRSATRCAGSGERNRVMDTRVKPAYDGLADGPGGIRHCFSRCPKR